MGNEEMRNKKWGNEEIRNRKWGNEEIRKIIYINYVYNHHHGINFHHNNFMTLL